MISCISDLRNEDVISRAFVKTSHIAISPIVYINPSSPCTTGRSIPYKSSKSHQLHDRNKILEKKETAKDCTVYSGSC